MRSLLSLIFILFACLLSPLQAQVIQETSTQTPDELIPIQSDSAFFSIDKRLLQDTITDVFKPNPTRVLWMSAIIPGSGQIMNRQFWKVPIVYGGFLACGYFISWNGSLYQDYKMGYRDIIDKDPNTNSYLDIIPPGYTLESIGGVERYTTILKRRQDQYRRSRDLSIIVTIAYYGLTILDAYTSAQLYDFDISPDLSMSVQPTLLPNQLGSVPNTFGVQICFNLK